MSIRQILGRIRDIVTGRPTSPPRVQTRQQVTTPSMQSPQARQKIHYNDLEISNPAEPVFEMWNIHGAMDYACTQWDGTIWEVGTGPTPVIDTHPNCKCTRDIFRFEDL